MGRKREVLIDQDEDIVAYEHNLSGSFVRVLVGFGTALPDGGFVPADNQNYENFIIQGIEYQNLMAANGSKPAGVFRREDLWSFVDKGRDNVIFEREKMALVRANLKEDKNAELANNTQEFVR